MSKPLTFARFAEKLNGRLAMQGTIWASKGFIHSHHGVFSQLKDPHNALVAVGVIGAVTLGTAITSGVLEKEPPKQDPNTIWTDDAEDLNGRVAMVSFPFLAIALEAVEQFNF